MCNINHHTCKNASFIKLIFQILYKILKIIRNSTSIANLIK